MPQSEDTMHAPADGAGALPLARDIPASERARDIQGEMFDLAPVSLWFEDYSRLKSLFDRWRRDGVTDLRMFLEADTRRVAACSDLIRVVKVNDRTLSLFGARDHAHLVDNLDQIFRNDMLETHIDELVQLWNGHPEFASDTVNYTLDGRRLDIQLRGRILPGAEESWDRVLVAIEDVTEREIARRDLAQSEEYAQGLFEHSPISLWVEDFSTIRTLLDDVRRQGISDFRVFTDVHPDFVDRCMSEIRVIDVNQHTLDLFQAPDKATLLRRTRDIFRDDMRFNFREQLIDLWDGKIFQQREVLNYALDGEEVHVQMQFSVFPGHEDDWSLVQVALTDITARKKAEAYLEFLGKHDVLTKLYNRSFYVDEINRLERKGPALITVIVADMNGLKAANDHLGHAAGDDLLRRAGEVLTKIVESPCCVARIGGDEFALLLPGVDEKEAVTMMENIEKLTDLNNQFYSTLNLSFAMGAATRAPGERLEEVVKRADQRMYEAKRAYHARLKEELGSAAV